MELNITNEDKSYLRELASKYREYSELDVMQERTDHWYAHNELKSDRPVIVMENCTFEEDFLPPLRCSTEAGRYIEKILQIEILNFEMINDDKVIPPWFPLDLQIEFTAFGKGIEHKHAEDEMGRTIGYESRHLVKNIREDLPKLSRSIYSVDRDGTLEMKAFIEEQIGDILPVRIRNTTNRWNMTPSAAIVDLMGMEAMMYAMFDEPEQLHQLFSFVKDDIMEFIKWQEKEGLLTLNNGNDYAGSGSYGFTRELPTPGFRETENVTTRDLWANMNSQESVGISPEMFGEFIYPSYRDMAEEFGLVYYGCCEPVHDVWEEYISRLPHLRKVSVSPWCDEKRMGEYLAGENVIYSRKPSPNYIGVGKDLDEKAFADHISATLDAAKGNTLEIVFRDIYTLEGNVRKPGRAVEIVRDLISRKW